MTSGTPIRSATCSQSARLFAGQLAILFPMAARLLRRRDWW